MSERVIPRTRYNGHPVYKLRCCKCSVECMLAMPTEGNGHIPFTTLKRKFSRLGWTVGKRDTRDVCPVCTSNQQSPGSMHYEDVQTYSEAQAVLGALADATAYARGGVIIRVSMEDEMADNVTPIKADAPRQMQRSDRQVIFAKLQDVYPKEDAGYAGDWTDEKVAKDLAVPRAWVETIREENFGQVVDQEAKARREAEEVERAYRREIEMRFKQLGVHLSNLKAAIAGYEAAHEHMRTYLFGDKAASKPVRPKAAG